jgi:hypothetical protein
VPFELGDKGENRSSMNAPGVGHAIKIARLIEGYSSGVGAVGAACKGMKDFLGPGAIGSRREFENTERAGRIEVPARSRTKRPYGPLRPSMAVNA